MSGEDVSTRSPSADSPPPDPTLTPPPKGLWEEHKTKVVGGICLAAGLTSYNFFGDIIGRGLNDWFGQQVVSQREIKELVLEVKENTKRQKLMEQDLKRMEEKIDLQTEFIQNILGNSPSRGDP